MAFKGSTYKLSMLLLLLVVSVAVVVYLACIKNYPFMIVFLPVSVFAVYAIFRLFSQNVRKLTFMFNSIANHDYSFKFTEYSAPASDNLMNMSLNRIRDLLIAEKADIARMEEYYKLIINSVNTGVLVLNENGSIYQSNNEAHRLLRLPVLTHINQLTRIDDSLPSVFSAMQPAQRLNVSFNTETGTVNLQLRASEIMVKGKPVRIIAINEIGSELDEREVESWMKLTRVLTHEIMNSITPITSLTDTLLELPVKESDKEIKQGLKTIKATGSSLLTFVDSYRKFTRIPEPELRLFYLKPLLDRLVTLNSSTLPIEVKLQPEDMLVYADETLLFQVLTNLLTNALYAVRNMPQPRVQISAFINSDDNVVVEVIDNGPGIPEDIRAQIFVPFFTTKKDGSGIGLSISRQIMRLHNGTLSFTTAPNETRFILTFK